MRFLECIFGCFHRWSKWSKDINVFTQIRTCEKCGRHQTKKIIGWRE